ncbi:MAG: cytochrome P450 [Jatrophihabitans sp.]|uniref:cytochrome P450 n=1 Tax=Jatrophihabitans sp. TaxID=1932789 RepID=UPI003F7D00FA
MPEVVLPPRTRMPRLVQGLMMMGAPGSLIRRQRRNHGTAFTVDVPIFGRGVVLSDPAEVKQLFLTSPELVDQIEPNLGRVLGEHSFFALKGEQHKRQRKLLVPPFHGRRLKAYERIVEEETQRAIATWPTGAEFATLPSMMAITLNVILRAVFGAEGAEFDELREVLPKWVELGSKLAVLPVPQWDLGRLSPWGRFHAMRREYDAIVDRLIAKAEQDDLDARDDVLALMLQARYDDGGRMSRDEIADQLLTLLTAGHETTATSLAWAFERLRRHPDVLRRLVAEVDAGGSELREAALVEVQRTRPVIDFTGRQVKAPSVTIGRWTLPRGINVFVSIYLMHNDPQLFPNPERFDPDRFVGARPDTYQWIPFGGGVRRCIGAAFASMEMDVTLRTVLRELTLEPTTAPGEKWHSRGVASAPADGGRVVVHRRRAATSTADASRTIVEVAL